MCVCVCVRKGSSSGQVMFGRDEAITPLQPPHLQEKAGGGGEHITATFSLVLDASVRGFRLLARDILQLKCYITCDTYHAITADSYKCIVRY